MQKKLRNYQRKRADATPKAPVTLIGVKEAFAKEQTLLKYGFTSGEHPTKFYVDTIIEKTYGFTLFVTQNIVSLLDTLPERRYFADGTFDVVPKSCFKQLFIIHVQIANHVSVLIRIMYKHLIFLF